MLPVRNPSRTHGGKDQHFVTVLVAKTKLELARDALEARINVVLDGLGVLGKTERDNSAP